MSEKNTPGTPPIKTAAELTAFLQTWAAQHSIALNGVIDSLPEGVRAEWQSLKDGLNATLAKLAPTDQVPAALEAGYALNRFSSAFADFVSYTDMLRDRLVAMGASLTKQTVALNGFETQLASGDLMPKEKFTPLIDAARSEGAATGLAGVTAARRSMIALAGLPEATPAILALGVAEFDAAVTLARGQVTTLAGKGLTLGGKGAAWVNDLAWVSAQAFQGQMTKIEELVTGSAKPAPVADPLLGAGAKAEVTPAAAAPAKKITLA